MGLTRQSRSISLINNGLCFQTAGSGERIAGPPESVHQYKSGLKRYICTLAQQTGLGYVLSVGPCTEITAVNNKMFLFSSTSTQVWGSQLDSQEVSTYGQIIGLQQMAITLHDLGAAPPTGA